MITDIKRDDHKKKSYSSRFGTLKQQLVKIALSSTSHGLSNIFRVEKYYFKIMWLAFYLTAWSSIIVIFYKYFIDFLTYPVVTNIKSEWEVPTVFPAVTFCNNFINYFDASNKTSTDLKAILNSNSTFIKKKLLLHEYKENLDTELYLNYSRKLNLSDLAEQVLISCTFDNEPCDLNALSQYYISGMGLCLKFNGKFTSKNFTAKNSKRVGSVTGAGLKVEMYLGTSPLSFIEPSHSAYVIIHDNFKRPSWNEGFRVSAGIETFIGISKTKDSKLPYPYNDCYSLENLEDYDSDMYRETFKFFNKYIQKDCYDVCLRRHIQDKCNCIIQVYHGDFIDLCKNKTCNEIVSHEFYEGSTQQTCDECPRQCNTITYSYSPWFADYPTKNYAEFLLNHTFLKQKKLTKESLKNKIVAFNVYYNDFKYTEITQIAKAMPLDLVASVGGFLGLFMGTSFLTFVEGIQALLTVIIVLCGCDVFYTN